MPGIIVPFVGETHRDAIAIVGPKFLDQPVVQLLRPLSFEKFDDLLSATWKFGAISPARVDCVNGVAGDVLPAALSFSIWESAVADQLSSFPWILISLPLL